MNMKNLISKTELPTAFTAEYSSLLDGYFSFLTEEQLKDETLWKLLVKQFEEKSDAGDNGWRGEFWGKLMRGASMVYAYSHDKELYRVMEKTVEDLLKTQEPSGRISTYPAEKEFVGWDMWGRKYVMLGLEYFYSVCTKDGLKRRILRALAGHADYIMSKVGDGAGKISVYETSTAWGAINSVSIVQPFVRLYMLTGDKNYLSYAESLIRSRDGDEPNVFELAYRNEKAPYEYPVTKAYEMISCFEGLLDYYKATGRAECLTACVNFADRVLETDFTLIGASGCRDEYFDNSAKVQLDRSEIHKQETCVTVTLMKFFAALYECTGRSEYIDAVETSFWNAYLGALNESKNDGYQARPLFYSYSPIYDNPRWTLMGGYKNISSYAVCGCCVAIAAAGLGVIPTVGVLQSGSGVTVNFFYGGRYGLGKETVLKIKSEYPYGGKIVLTVERARAPLNLKLRRPAWCGEFSLKKNGAETAFDEKDGYLILSDPVSAGESIEYELAMPLRVILSETFDKTRNDLFAVAKGPLVLCLDSENGDEEKTYSLKTDEKGCVAAEKNDKMSYTVPTTDGGGLKLTEYRSSGKNYYEPRDISVWIKR